MWTITDPKSMQHPVRRGRALAADRPHLLVAQRRDDAVGDGVELPLRPARADDEVVGEGRQRARARAATMSAAFLSSASSTTRRASSSAAALTGDARRGRCRGAAGRRRFGASALGSAGSVTIDGSSPLVLVEAMVADIRRDRIRHEIADRASVRRPGAGSPRPTGGCAGRRGRRRGRAIAGKCRGDQARVALPGTVARRDDEVGQSRTRSGCAPGRQLGERLGRQDERQRCSSGSRRAATASVSTVYDGPPRSISMRLDLERRVAGDRQPRPSRADARPGVIAPVRLVRRLGRPG